MSSHQTGYLRPLDVRTTTTPGRGVITHCILRLLPASLLLALALAVAGCGGGDSGSGAGGGPSPGAWETPGRLDSLAGTVEALAAVVDGSGNVTALWNQDDGTARSIYASRFDAAGNSWSAPVPLENENGGDAFNVQAAVNSSGVILAVWVQNTGAQLNLDYSRYTPGSGWSAAASIATAITSTGQPKVAIDSNGDGFAVWHTGLSATPNIFASRFTGTTATWAAPDTIDSENLGTLEPLAGGIVFLSTGDAVAVWQQFDGSWQNVWANTYSATGSAWGTAGKLEAQIYGAGRPHIAVGGDDSVMAVWDQLAVYGNRYTGSWSGETDLRTDTGTGGSGSAVAAAANGDAMAVWVQSNGSKNDIKSRLYTASGTSWGTVAAADTDDAVSMSQPSVASLGSGNYAVAWQEATTPGNIWVNTYKAGAWGAPQGLDSADGAVQSPTMLADGSGRITVIWRQEGSTANIYDLWAVRSR